MGWCYCWRMWFLPCNNFSLEICSSPPAGSALSSRGRIQVCALQPFFRCGGNRSAAQTRNGVHFGSDMRMRYPGSTSLIDMIYKGFVYAKMREKERGKKKGLQLSCIWNAGPWSQPLLLPVRTVVVMACSAWAIIRYTLLFWGNSWWEMLPFCSDV